MDMTCGATVKSQNVRTGGLGFLDLSRNLHKMGNRVGLDCGIQSAASNFYKVQTWNSVECTSEYGMRRDSEIRKCTDGKVSSFGRAAETLQIRKQRWAWLWNPICCFETFTKHKHEIVQTLLVNRTCGAAMEFDNKRAGRCKLVVLSRSLWEIRNKYRLDCEIQSAVLRLAQSTSKKKIRTY